MPNQGAQDVSLDLFGGLVTDMSPTVLPPGVSPDCQDVAFLVGGVKTRPGLGAGMFSAIGGNPTVNYLKTYITPQQELRLLVLDSAGALWKEISQGVLAAVAAGITAPYAASASLFGREYIACGDGKAGSDIPRQFDDTYFDRVSQAGPGAPPTVVDHAAESAKTIAAAATGAVRAGSLVTITTTAAHGYGVGSNVLIAGVTDTSFNGTFPISGVPSTTAFTYQQAGGAATSGAGTSTLQPKIVTGLRLLAVSFVTRQGYNTPPSVVGTWTAAGGFRADVSDIPVGPPNIIARILSFTLAGGGSLFYVPNSSMVIQDNVSTTAVVDFSETQLAAGINVTANLAPLVELGECVGVIDYSSRLFWFGERNKVPNFNNLTFDGGFRAVGSSPASTSAGPNSPSVATDQGGGANFWVTPNNIFVLDGITTDNTVDPLDVTTFLIASGYGFAIPSNATIMGIKVVANVKSGGPGINFADDAVLILKGGLLTGTDHSSGTLWPASIAPHTYGGSADLWGTTWTPNEINAAGFGVGIAAQNINPFSTRTCSVDYISIQVYYTTPVTGGTVGPLGWTQTADYAGGASALTGGFTAHWADAFAITGDGATAIRGKISQTAYQNALGTPIIERNVAYRVRARAASAGGLNAGTLHINLQSTSGAFTTPGLSVQAVDTTAGYVEFDGVLTTELISPPADLILQVYADGTPNNNGVFLVDSIEVYPTKTPVNLTRVRASKVNDPESYNGINGVLDVWPQNGQAVRSAFRIRDRLYFVKERSFYVTDDDGVNEPSGWTISEVSSTVGTPSVNGVDVGEDWAVIADRNGPYIFWGGEPVKIGQEIQSDKSRQTLQRTWQEINWNYGHTIWTRVDRANKRILFGVPMGNATSPNVILVLDYRGCADAQDIADTAGVRVSSYSGRIIAVDKGRKWTPWRITANCATLAPRFDGTDRLLLGSGAASGKVYQPDESNFDDDGAAIDSYYMSYFFLDGNQEQQMQLGSHRKLFNYATAFVEGKGLLTISAVPPGNLIPKNLITIALANPGTPATISAIARAGGLVTVTTAAVHGLTSLNLAVISGVADPSFNGNQGITVIGPQQFTYRQDGLPDGNSAGGTAALGTRDIETTVSVPIERCAFKLGTNAPGSWFSLEKLSLSVEPDPMAPVRGAN